MIARGSGAIRGGKPSGSRGAPTGGGYGSGGGLNAAIRGIVATLGAMKGMKGGVGTNGVPVKGNA